MKYNEIHIMYGLPGSGKTFWCSQNWRNGIQYIDLDEHLKERYNCMSSIQREDFGEMLVSIFSENICRFIKTVFIDGLITNTEILCSVCTSVMNVLHNDIKFIIHAWNEDRESCLFNDSGRRNISSQISINRLRFDIINDVADILSAMPKLPQNVTFALEKHVVQKKPMFKKCFANYSVIPPDRCCSNAHKDNCLRSDKWCTGGSACNYMGDTSYVSPDKPEDFEELYDLLEKIDPNMPFFTVRKIQKEYVTLESWQEDDYYGGGIGYSRWCIDLEKLYEFLNANGYSLNR